MFEQLFATHYPRVVSMLVRVTGTRARAEEIAADVFSKLASQPKGGEDLLPWLYRTASNAGLDVARANARARKLPAVPDRVEPEALDKLLQAERDAKVRRVLGELKPRDAELLLLRAEGMSYKELAAACEVSAGSVGTLLVRAEAEFARRYQARFGDRR